MSAFYSEHQRAALDTLFPAGTDHHDFLASLGEFAAREIMPGAQKIDKDGAFPEDLYDRMVERGLFGLSLPRAYGGSGMPFPVCAAALEMLAKACANTALRVSVQGMVAEGIVMYGTEEQKQDLLVDRGCAKGTGRLAFALTEPCCGSDAKALRTKAVLAGGGYVLEGTKTLITNALDARFFLVFARTERGISALLVPADAPRCTVTKDMPKLGFRGNSLSSMRFERCEVPSDCLLGEEGKGLEYAKEILNVGRITIAAIAVGIAQAAFDKALRYSSGRKAFGEPIAGFQLIQEKLADMVTDIRAARLLTYYAACRREKGLPVAAEAAQAKLFASEAALRVCDQALQVHGGYGYVDAYDIHRHWRDARLLTIGEGTSEMLRILIAHRALREE